MFIFLPDNNQHMVQVLIKKLRLFIKSTLFYQTTFFNRENMLGVMNITYSLSNLCRCHKVVGRIMKRVSSCTRKHCKEWKYLLIQKFNLIKECQRWLQNLFSLLIRSIVVSYIEIDINMKFIAVKFIGELSSVNTCTYNRCWLNSEIVFSVAKTVTE